PLPLLADDRLKGCRHRRHVDHLHEQVVASITPAGETICDAAGPIHVTSVRNHFMDHVPRPALPVIADVFNRLYAFQRQG
ncbi:MAG TPA: hypothetical protein PKA24_14235, partial [Microthrixaceae bacterium]|nr:hypothetical protein [Microthrixaceae bacterium]